MARLLIMLDPGAGVKPADVAAAWNADDEASAAGLARAETASGSEYLPGVMELIAIPLAVNLASSAVYALVRKLVTRLRLQREEDPGLEMTEVTIRDGDRLVVVRLGGTRL